MESAEAADEMGHGKVHGEDDEDHPLVATWTFEPHKGNVVFSSAMDCWGFGIGRFALYWATKLSCNRGALQKHMFDDYAFNSASKKIVRIDPYASTVMKPMFVTMILEPLWQMYDVTLNQQNAKKAANMAKRAVSGWLGVEIASRDIAAPGADCKNTLRAIMRLWMPLADAILRAIVRTVPDPAIAQANKLSNLFPKTQLSIPSPGNPLVGSYKTSVATADPERAFQVGDTVEGIKRRVATCEISPPASPEVDAEVIVFVSKMIPVRVAELTP
ncbi:RIA1, partial [Symbiodinium microadriaticum]